VATISANGEKEVGQLLADAMERVSKDGVITIQVSAPKPEIQNPRPETRNPKHETLHWKTKALNSELRTLN
jgi:hypothetical protein